MLQLYLGPPDNGSAWTLDFFLSMFLVYLPQIALVSLPTVLLFTLAMAMLEGPGPKGLATWLVVSFIVITPGALFVWAIGNMGDCFDSCAKRGVSPLPLILYALGLLGAAAAWRVRKWVWMR